MTEPAPVPEPTATPLLPKAPSRLGAWLRRGLPWATGLAVVFALGLGATWFAQVRPLQSRIQSLDQARTVLETQVAGLELQVKDMEAIRSENITVKVRVARLEQQSLALQALAATSQAQVALATGATVELQADLLAAADAHLAALEKLLAGSMKQDMQSLRERLALALGELTSDPFAAQRDLEVLANALSNLVTQLSGD